MSFQSPTSPFIVNRVRMVSQKYEKSVNLLSIFAFPLIIFGWFLQTHLFSFFKKTGWWGHQSSKCVSQNRFRKKFVEFTWKHWRWAFFILKMKDACGFTKKKKSILDNFLWILQFFSEKVFLTSNHMQLPFSLSTIDFNRDPV